MMAPTCAELHAQALTYSLALLRHWNGMPSNYVALIDVDEYIVIDQPKARRGSAFAAPAAHGPCPAALSVAFVHGRTNP